MDLHSRGDLTTRLLTVTGKRQTLTEASHKRHPKKAAAVAQTMFDKDTPVALCTHRPVLPTVLKLIARHASPELAAQLPAKDPYLSPGEMIVLVGVQEHLLRSRALGRPTI